MRVKGFAVAIASAVIASSAAADSMDYSFFNITNNGGDDLSGQLNMNVSTTGDVTMVDFRFTNNVGIMSSVAEIYFDDGNPAGSLFSAFILAQGDSTFLHGAASPGDLPGGNALNPDFEVSAGFLADHGAGGPTTGLDTAADFLTIRATLVSGMTYNDVIARLASGDLRVGLHIISIANGGDNDSDSYVNVPFIPLPTTAAMGLVGMVGLASRRRR